MELGNVSYHHSSVAKKSQGRKRLKPTKVSYKEPICGVNPLFEAYLDSRTLSVKGAMPSDAVRKQARKRKFSSLENGKMADTAGEPSLKDSDIGERPGTKKRPTQNSAPVVADLIPPPDNGSEGVEEAKDITADDRTAQQHPQRFIVFIGT